MTHYDADQEAAVPESGTSEAPETSTAPAEQTGEATPTVPVVPDPAVPVVPDPAVPVVTAPTPAVEPTPEADGPRRRRWPTFLLALVVLAAAAYLAGAVAFMNVFLPDTTLNGRDVSLRTVGDVAAESSDASGDFSLAVSGQGVTLDISAASIKARYDGGAFARQAIKLQHPWLWPLEVTGTHELELDQAMSYDAARLTDLVGSAVDAVNKDAKAPVDASVAFNEESKRYEVKSEEAGTTLDKPAVVSAVRAAVGRREAKLELDDSVLVKPTVTSEDERLVNAAKQANASLEATQTLTSHDTTVATVGEEQLRQWVHLADDLSVTFDTEACTKWAQGDLSKQIDTYGSTRSYQRPDGKQVTVSGGTYGWICDGAQIASEIAENVREGKAASIEVPWKQEAASWNAGGQDWGSRYIDVDLAEQHVRFYDDGKVIWETDCVSGGLDDKGEMHSTPSGVYTINSNMRSGNVELRGKIDPKTNEPEYISHVEYWMPFIEDSVALHDADWRSSFGGDLYRSNGSHGCVNLPVGKARDLYGMVSVGTVVVVHE